MANIEEPFYIRHFSLLRWSIVGGMYHPYIDRIIPSCFVRRAFLIYAVINAACLVYLPCAAALHLLIKFDYNEAYLDLAIVVCGIYAIVRLVWIYLRWNLSLDMIKSWDAEFCTINEENSAEILRERQMHCEHFYKMIRKAIIPWNVFVFLSMNSWVFMQYFSKNKVMKYPTPFEYKNQSPDFEIILTIYQYTCLVHPVITGVVQLSILLPLCWEIGELTRLKSSIPTLIKKKGYSKKDLEADVAAWIRHHQRLLRYHKEKILPFVTGSFTIEMFATFMSGWLIAFQIAQEKLSFEDKVAYVGIFTPYIIQFQVTCSLCGSITELSEHVVDDTLSKGVSELPWKINKSLMMVKQRTLIPLNFRTFRIIPVNNESFMKVLKVSYSVVNVLLASTSSEKYYSSHNLE